MWAMKQELPVTEKMTLVVLADFHNGGTAQCNPEKNSIASKAGLSVRGVDGILHRLRKKGFIGFDSTSGRTSNSYVLNIEHGIQALTPQEVQGSTPKEMRGTNLSNPAGESTNPAGDSTNPAAAAPEPVRTSKEPDNAQSQFGRFWEPYPKKKDKKKTQAIWKKLKLDNKADQIIADVNKRKREDPQWQNHQYIPYPSTYLNGERWNDEIESVKTHGSEKGDIYARA